MSDIPNIVVNIKDLWPKQARLVDSGEHYYAWYDERNVGKTYALCAAAVTHCIEWPGATAFIIVPTHSFLRTYIQPMIASMLPKSRYGHITQRWELPNMSTLQLISIDPGNVRDVHRLAGSSATFIGVDQAGLYGYDSMRYMNSRLRRQQGVATPLRFREVGDLV